MNKKTQRALVILAIAGILLYFFRGKLMGLTGKTRGNNTGGGFLDNLGGGGGGSYGGGSNGTGSTGLNVGPYTYAGATAAEGYGNIGYKPPTGSDVTALPNYCISDAFTLNGVNYCVALDSRGNEVTRRIS